jgi:hypothetical protein
MLSFCQLGCLLHFDRDACKNKHDENNPKKNEIKKE